MTNKLRIAFRSLNRRAQAGLTTVEYAIAGSLISLAVVGAFTNLGVAVTTAINDIIGAL